MKAYEAAIQILAEAEKPLHVNEITARILKAGLWQSRGKTPEATVGAQIYTHIKNNGDNSLFVQVGSKTFALRESSSVSSKSGITFGDCAQKVLEELGDGLPMHYREITKKALEQGWLITAGQTPENTMYAQFVNEIKRQQKLGKQSRFVRHGRGYFGLGQGRHQGLTSQIEQHNEQVRKALRKRLMSMPPKKFEELIAQLLAEVGFESVEVTKLGSDGGIDVRGILVVGNVIRTRMAVQVKRWKNNIQSPVVQQVRGSLGAHEQGLVITTSNFSKGAVTEAVQSDKAPIALMNGEQLVTLLMEHGIGVERTTPDLFELDEAFAAGGTDRSF